MTTHPEDPRTLLVRRMTWEADGVLSVELVHPDGKPLAPWSPGSHLDLHVGGHIRQYSLCGDPADATRYRVAVLNEPSSRGGSRHVHTKLRPGQSVTVAGPRNHYALEPAGSYLFIAGGIGITPILAHARQAEREGIPYRLIHGGRSRASMAFGTELAALDGGEVTFVPQDEQGHIDLAAALAGLPADALVYCCGPAPLLDAVEAACPAGQLRTERFAAPIVERTGDDAAFEVEFRASGTTATVPAGLSILEAAERAGVQAASSCRDGICGTCETRVLAGTPDHRDFLLSDAEKESAETMMICVSRCSSDRLVLDL
ncbi:PDR/VanB family oxidoreductase [Streptomyces indicus]|uniref:Ferredoxin-NADP reductase n=1 Tax=Streptomyces indicus TaxID=417292 RepID=A0A1G8T987_9ACTN|nr:PDR/VanB family oxidoreductase [Streptomyces indicus]SDJ38132.1 Ferredoxin-NADP reductase [Streptomyces indicus]